MNEVIFNKDQLLTMSADDEELAAQVAGVFLFDIPRQLTTLKEAITSGETKVAERTVHSIKGASATVGGEALREIAFTGEQLARDGKLDELSVIVPEINTQFRLLKAALEDAGYEEMNMDA